MTKKVRIENADTADHKVVVQVWDQGSNGEPDVMFCETELSHPCAMAAPHLTATRYLVVKQA